ncbi:MAG TPA: TetR/AcrR family transcriptional regulator [Firmicutes bacterium]|nr:TetR/AcrR family transcriptional regulator [Bacillota bacterium]
MAENRRVKLTKKMMKDAVLELLEHKSLEKITVTDICERADVNRSTFYAYYESIGQLLFEIENDVLNQLPVPPDLPKDYSDEKFLDMLEEFFDYVRENERLFRILIIQRDSSEFNHRLVNAVMDKYRMPVGEGGSLPARYAYVYCVNGVIGILKEWIHDKFPLSSRAFAGIVLQMSYRAISG